MTKKQVSLSGIMDVSKNRRKRKRSQEKTADEFVEVSVPLLAAEEAVDNGQPKGNDHRGHANAEEYHEELLFDPPNPSVVQQSDELDSNGSEFLEASLSSFINNSTESETQLLDEWLKNDNRDRNLPSDSLDPDFDELWSYVRDDLLNQREDNFEDELNSVMDAEDEDVWFDVEEHLQLSDNAGVFSSLPNISQCGNPQQPEENTPGPKEKTDLDQEPLYKGANVTLGSVMVLLVLFVIRHNLTSEALENLLSIIAALLPASSILPNSVSRFKKYFANLKHPFVFHHYCSFCFAYISQRGVKRCTNSHCLQDLPAKGGTSYFIEIPIVDQLQTMFSRSGFYKDLQHRFNRKKQAQENIEDIYDGRLYRSLVRKGILSSGNNISFILTLTVSQYLSRQKFLFGPSISSSTNYLITRGSQKKICFLQGCGLVKKSQPCGHF